MFYQPGIREILERYTFVFGGQPYRVHGSIGVALIDYDTESAGEALANADIACHIAKSQGRNQTHVYQPASDEKLAMNVDLGWSTRLQEALHSDGFVLYFQPVVPIRGFTAATLPADIDAWGMRCMDGVVHCEALVRLPDVHGGVIAPGAFLPTAERFGLMPQIDLWVVRAAIARLARLN